MNTVDCKLKIDKILIYSLVYVSTFFDFHIRDLDKKCENGQGYVFEGRSI
jgi:hypothetical protein